MPPSYLMGALDDALGEYLEGGEDLGYEEAIGRGRRRRRPLRRRLNAAQALASRLVPPVPGVPPPGVRRLPLGFPVAIFAAASGLALIRTTRPQIPMAGARLVVVVTRAGASATGLVTITDIKVGQRSQLGSVDPIPAEAFAPNAFGVALDLDPAQPGIDISLAFAITAAPAMTDTVNVAAALINPSVG